MGRMFLVKAHSLRLIQYPYFFSDTEIVIVPVSWYVINDFIMESWSQEGRFLNHGGYLQGKSPGSDQATMISLNECSDDQVEYSVALLLKGLNIS